LVIAGDPEGEDGFQSFGAREVCAQPDFFEGFEDLGLGVERSPAGFLVLGFAEAFKFSEDPDGVFAVIA